MFEIIAHSMILALGLILPLGVQNVFVFQQGINQPSYIRVLPVIITASLCDTLLIILSVTGISVLIFGNEVLRIILMTIGILMLLFMGFTTWKEQPKVRDNKSSAYSLKRQVVFASSVSLLNPHAILDTIGVIGTSSLQYVGKEKVIFSLTCILVSWFWFALLGFAGRFLGERDISEKWMSLLNKISAVFIWLVAFYLAISIIG